MFTNDKRQEERTGRSGTPRADFLQNLVTQFQNATTEELKERIAANLANFAYDPYNYTFLRQLNVLELFLDCLTEPNEKLKEFGAGGICNASVDPANAAMITRCGGIPLVIECLYSPVRNTFMMAKEDGNTLSLKLLVDKHSKRVLFGEAGKDFVDFLFHIMTLPVGTMVRLIKANGMVGCVGNLYRSIENMGDVYMEPAANKEVLLQPNSPSCGASFPLLLPDSSTSARKTYYKCSVGGRSSNYHYCCPNVADYPNATCPTCSKAMTQQVILLEEQQVKTGTIPSSGYVKEVVTYMVMDDLEVKPMSTISSITMLNRFNVKDVGALEEKVIAVGMNEAVELLKASLYSKNVLTDVFFGKV